MDLVSLSCAILPAPSSSFTPLLRSVPRQLTLPQRTKTAAAQYPPTPCDIESIESMDLLSLLPVSPVPPPALSSSWDCTASVVLSEPDRSTRNGKNCISVDTTLDERVESYNSPRHIKYSEGKKINNRHSSDLILQSHWSRLTIQLCRTNRENKFPFFFLSKNVLLKWWSDSMVILRNSSTKYDGRVNTSSH